MSTSCPGRYFGLLAGFFYTGLGCWLSLGNRFPASIDFQARFAILSSQGDLGVLFSHWKVMEDGCQLSNGTHTASDKKPSFFCYLNSRLFTVTRSCFSVRDHRLQDHLGGCGCTETNYHQPFGFFFFKKVITLLSKAKIFPILLALLMVTQLATPASQNDGCRFSTLGAITLVNLTSVWTRFRYLIIPQEGGCPPM